MLAIMDRAELQQSLAEAERHVAVSARHIARQRKLIVELESRGEDATEAREVLDSLRQTQRLHVERRDRLRTELFGPGS
jgi:hypothetical protein